MRLVNRHDGALQALLETLRAIKAQQPPPERWVIYVRLGELMPLLQRRKEARKKLARLARRLTCH